MPRPYATILKQVHGKAIESNRCVSVTQWGCTGLVDGLGLQSITMPACVHRTVRRSWPIALHHQDPASVACLLSRAKRRGAAHHGPTLPR